MLHEYRCGGGQSSQATTVTAGEGGMAATAEASTLISLFFPIPSVGLEEDTHCSYDDHSGISTVTASASTPSSSPVSASSFSSSAGTVVDCTLSLGRTPPSSVSAHAVSCWDGTDSYYYHQQQQQQGKHTATCRVAAVHDQFRRCASCGTSSTPLWRNGPRGPKSLCNACGIRFKKEERRRAAEGSSGAAFSAWPERASCLFQHN